jgi:glycine cleavage system aminomethyltransferase T
VRPVVHEPSRTVGSSPLFGDAVTVIGSSKLWHRAGTRWSRTLRTRFARAEAGRYDSSREGGGAMKTTQPRSPSRPTPGGALRAALERPRYEVLPLNGITDDVLAHVPRAVKLSLADSDVELWARGVAHNSNYDVTIKEVDVAPVQVQGPKSKDVMVDLFGESILDIPYYYLRSYELDGMKVLVSRTGYTSELGFEIYLYDATKNGIKLWDAVLEAGKPHDLAVIGPCHIRRIEGGILALGPGCDMWYDTNPYEVGMGYDWMVDLEQASDFIGKEALAKIKADGPKRQLVGVEIGGSNAGSYNDGAMIDVWPVHHNGARIGQVTSACYSPRLEKNIGYAMVPTEHSELGTEFEVERPDETVSAVVVPKPFVDPQKETPKQELTAAES